MKKQIQTIKGLAIAGLLIGALLMIPALVGANPPGDPPAATVDANFNKVTIGPGSIDYVVSDGGGGDTSIESGGDITLDMNSGIGSLFFQKAGSSNGLSMNSSTIWMPFGDPVQIADNLDVTGSISNSTGPVTIADDVNFAGGDVGIGTTLPAAKLHVTGGITGVIGEGTTYGGYFKDTDSSGYSYVGNANYGIRSFGTAMGGYFEDSDSSGVAQVASADYGVYAQGNSAGGYFSDLNSSGYAQAGYGDYGIYAQGNYTGGYFKDSDNSGYAHVGAADYGISAWGNSAGGQFNDIDNSGWAWVGYGDYGIQAYGNTAGGHFEDTDSTGRADIGVGSNGVNGYGTTGVYGSGTTYGARFYDSDSSGYAYIGYNDAGIYARGNSYGAFLSDRDSGKYAYIGYGGYSLYGNGVVTGSSWQTYSDARMKNIVGDYESGLDEIMTLEPVEFKYKDGNMIDMDSNDLHVGLIAQEVQKILPQAVTEGEGKMLSLEPNVVSMAMINAIQELKSEKDEEIAELKEEIAALRGVVCELKPNICNL